MGCFDNIEGFRESKRYLNKDNTVGVRSMYSNIWKEYINLYGVQTAYYKHGYSLETQDDFIYGEDPTEPFKDPEIVNMIVEYQTDALLLSKFGLETNSDLTAIVSVEDYQNLFGIGAEPKAGDVIELTEAGWLASEMPLYDGIMSHYNVITNLESLNIYPISASNISFELMAPVKEVVTETILSYCIPMYSTTDTVTSELYPIENDLLSISMSISSEYYLRIPLNDELYFIPLRTPSGDAEMPGINSLYFNYDIVDINSEPLSAEGYFPFEYQGTPILMPTFQYSTTGEPLPATVIHSAGDITHIELDAKTILCKYQDAEYASSILIELSAVYGSKYIRYPQLFEITEARYQDLSQAGLNVAQGHYVWKLHAKRFDYSFEPNAPKEGNFDQVYDNSFSGIVSSLGNDPSPEKEYSQKVEDASEEIWDYDEKGTNTGPYGYY